MRNNIRAFRTRAGLTQADLAEATGVGIPQVSKWEAGRVDIPTERLKAIATVLRTTPDQLLSDNFMYPLHNAVWKMPDGHVRPATGAITQTSPPPDNSHEIEPTTNAAVIRMEGASEERMQRSLPLYGTALGAPREVDGEAIEQVTLNRAEVLEYVRRPVILNGNAAAYGLRVEGYSMEPRHRDGEMLIVDPHGKVRIGDDVIVYLRPLNPDDDDGETARAVLVKRIVRRSSGFIELEQYQPAKTFRIDMADVLRIDRVVPWHELLT